MKQCIKPAVFALGLLGVAGQASAHVLPGGSVMDFENGTITSTFAPPSTGQMPSSLFPAFGGSYIEEGVVHSAIGFGTSPGNSIGTAAGGGSHVHGENAGTRVSAYLPDSGGGLFQLADNAAFGITGMDVVNMHFNKVGGGATTMTLRGYTAADFSTWTDVTLGGGSDGLTATSVNGDFLTETGNSVNGFTGTHLHLDEVADFGNIYLFEYFYDALGRGTDGSFTPAFGDFAFRIDNVEFAPAAVPVPAAAYLFGTALMGLFGFGKKRRGAAMMEA